MSSEGAGSSSNNAAKPKGVVDLCDLSDSDSDDESNDSVSGKECPDPSASAPDPILKEEPGEPEPTLQCTGSSSSSTQVQDDDSQVGRVPKCAESESKSGKEKQDHGEVVDNCSDNENDSSGAADDTERNDSAQKENPGLSNIANMTEGPQAQRRNAESDDLVKKARAALMKIINYLHKQKEEPPQVLTVQFFKTFRGRELKLNNSPVSARDVGYGPGLIWDDISPLVSGTDAHEDTRTEALNNALARNHNWFKIEKLERFEERDGSMIGSFEIHFNEEMTFRHSDFADARNESDESEGEDSDDEGLDDEGLDDEGLDDEDSDNEGHQRSLSKKKQKRKKGPTTIIVRIIKRIARHTSQTSASRKVVYGKPLKGGKGVQIRVDDEPIPAKDVHFEAGASLDAIRALIHNCDSIDQQTNAINDILEDAGCKVRVRKVNFTKAEESEDKVFGTFRIEMPKSGSPSLRRASTEDAEDENLRPRSRRVQTKTSFYHNTEHCHGSKRKRDTDAGTSKGNLSKKTSTQGASSSSRSDADTVSMSHSSVDASNQSRNDDGSKRRRRGSNASNTSQGDVTAINTNTSDTASVVTTQSNAVEEEQRQEEEEQEQEKEEQQQEKEEQQQEQEDDATRRFKLLFQMAPKDVQLQLLKESLASIEKFG